MLIELPGGFDYTGAQCSEWFEEEEDSARPTSSTWRGLIPWWQASSSSQKRRDSPHLRSSPITISPPISVSGGEVLALPA